MVSILQHNNATHTFEWHVIVQTDRGNSSIVAIVLQRNAWDKLPAMEKEATLAHNSACDRSFDAGLTESKQWEHDMLIQETQTAAVTIILLQVLPSSISPQWLIPRLLKVPFLPTLPSWQPHFNPWITRAFNIYSDIQSKVTWKHTKNLK